MAKVMKSVVLLALALSALTALFALEAKRVVVCTAVENREPVGASESFPASAGELVCFSEVTGAGGAAEITHVWALDGAERFRVSLPVRADRWRTWSRKRVSPGSWTVTVLGPSGEELGKATFAVTP